MLNYDGLSMGRRSGKSQNGDENRSFHVEQGTIWAHGNWLCG
ncbi:hypothetical protein SB861_50695 [Paraburkholderia sp. SIMBA_049]